MSVRLKNSSRNIKLPTTQDLPINSLAVVIEGCWEGYIVHKLSDDKGFQVLGIDVQLRTDFKAAVRVLENGEELVYEL